MNTEEVPFRELALDLGSAILDSLRNPLERSGFSTATGVMRSQPWI